jgi:YD repeat-containing protein
MIDPNFDPLKIPFGCVYDKTGRLLTYRVETGFWCVYTRDVNGRVLTCITSAGCREDYTYDAAGKCTITRTQEVQYAA